MRVTASPEESRCNEGDDYGRALQTEEGEAPGAAVPGGARDAHRGAGVVRTAQLHAAFKSELTQLSTTRLAPAWF